MGKLILWAVGGFVSGVVATLGWQNRAKLVGTVKDTAGRIKDKAVALVSGAPKEEEKKDEPAVQG